MHPGVIARILGLVLMLFSLTHLPPFFVSLYYADGNLGTFALSFMGTLLLGFMAWYPARRIRGELRTRDCFVVVTLFWAVLSLVGSLPFLLTSSLKLGLTDAIFESVSDLTTTGATVITGLDSLPRSILYYRQQLEWFGGLGIIAIAVAIMPMLGIGGLQLYRAESPGPVKNDRLMPRITETAKALLLVYVGLTIVCGLAYLAAGMSPFDAVAHSLATISLGGLSPHDRSIGYFDSDAIHLIATFFMLISGAHFALHFYALRNRSLRHYFQDEEFRFYVGMLAMASVVTIIVLMVSGTYTPDEALVKGVFEVVSIGTTTGFISSDFRTWPSFLPFFLFYLAIIGACAGSTGGGIKVVRAVLIIKQGFREISRLVHPNAVIPIKLGGERVPDRVIESVWGFFSVYVMAYMIMLLALLAVGLDITTAFTAVGASINNLGAGLGDVAVTFGTLPTSAKWILCLGMLLGRLEVFTLLVLLSPQFWRR